MKRVTIELCLWLGKELGADFASPSEMRSVREEDVGGEMTIRQLLESLAKRYPVIAERVFDTKTRRVRPEVVVNYNDRAISPHIVHDKTLKDGDRVTILPLYTGG